MSDKSAADSNDEFDTEPNIDQPNIDAQMLRVALRVGLNQ